MQWKSSTKEECKWYKNCTKLFTTKKSKIGIEKINGTPSRELQRNHNHRQARTQDRETPSMKQHPSKSN